MPEEAKPKPSNADPEPENPDQGTGPKGSGTLRREVRPLNADPENPDQKPDSGTGGGKGEGTWNGDVEPGR